jgi:hypothetical protein
MFVAFNQLGILITIAVGSSKSEILIAGDVEWLKKDLRNVLWDWAWTQY